MNPETGEESPQVQQYLASHNRNDSLSQVLLAARELTSTPLAREAVIAELRGELTKPGFTSQNIQDLLASVQGFASEIPPSVA